MNLLKNISILLFLLFYTSVYCQQDSIRIKKQIRLKTTHYDPLKPAKAAFYSAILPGAGQIYNNRYWWQLPAIYGGLGASIYYYIDNNNAYNRFRTAFKLRSAGLPDEFNGKNGNPLLSINALESAQKKTRENRDMSLLSAILVYTLQIVEASVTAHLLQFDTSDDLSIQPTTIPDPSFKELPKVGLSIKYTF